MEDFENVMESPLGSPDRRKFKMRVKGDCFLYTSFYMIKKWFLVWVCISNFPRFRDSFKAFAVIEKKNILFTIGLILVSPFIFLTVIILGLMLLLVALVFLMLFISLCFFVLIFIIFLDLPLLVVLVIQSVMLLYIRSQLLISAEVVLTNSVFYLQLLVLGVLTYIGLKELSQGMNNILLIYGYYYRKRASSNWWCFFSFISITPQIIQIAIVGIVAFVSPDVIFSNNEIMTVLRNFALLVCVLHVNAFMTAFLRETKFYNLHYDVFQNLESSLKKEMIHFSSEEVQNKIIKIKCERIYNELWGSKYDTRFEKYKTIFAVKLLLKYLLVGGVILKLLSVTIIF